MHGLRAWSDAVLGGSKAGACRAAVHGVDNPLQADADAVRMRCCQPWPGWMDLADKKKQADWPAGIARERSDQ